jgi:hypothetical protein
LILSVLAASSLVLGTSVDVVGNSVVVAGSAGSSMERKNENEI